MKKYLLVIFCLWLISCKHETSSNTTASPQSPVRIGFYKSREPNKLEWINLKLQGIKSCYIGEGLTLKKDSSYHLYTCGIVATGSWHVDSGKLFLTEKYINWRLDTFRINGFEGRWPEVHKEPIVFVIKDNMIYKNYGDHIAMLEYKGEKPEPYTTKTLQEQGK